MAKVCQSKLFALKKPQRVPSQTQLQVFHHKFLSVELETL